MNLLLLKKRAGWLLLYAIGAGIMALLYSVTQVMEGHLIARLVDVIMGQDRAGLYRIIWFAVMVLTGAVVSAFTWQFLAVQFAERFSARLRRDVSARLSRAGNRAMHESHTGDLTSRISSDLPLFQEVLRRDIFLLFSGTITALLALAYMFSQNWQLTLALLATFPVIVVVVGFLSMPVAKHTGLAQGLLAALNAHAKEAVGGAEIVRAFNLQSFLAGRYSAREKDWFAHTYKKARQNNILIVFGVLMALLPVLVIFGFGGYLVLQNRLTVGMLFAFLQLSNYIAFPLQQLPQLAGRIKAGKVCAERVFELLEMEEERRGGDAGNMQGEELLRFEKVSYRYPGQSQWALRDVSFTVRRGERVALAGMSGSGKTTLFRLILGEEPAQEGTVYVGDTGLAAWSLSALRDNLAVVLQDPFLFDVTIDENVRLGRLSASPGECRQALATARVDDRLLDDRAREIPDGALDESFSGGQRQRLCLARALVRNAPLLLLDEATSALDNQTEARIIGDLLLLPRDRTILMIAHRLPPLVGVDRILVLDNGRIVEQGTHQELMAQKGKYALLFGLQTIQEAQT